MEFDYVVEKLEAVTLDIAREDGLLAGYDLMSPYVWEDRHGIKCLLVRAVRNPLGAEDPTGIIYSGTCEDGLRFTMFPKPAIVPGPDAIDAGGVEDPTVVLSKNGELLVFFTGVEAKRAQASLLVARGKDLNS